MEHAYEVLYLCNGKRPECSGKCGCITMNGYCHHTTDRAYARSQSDISALDAFMTKFIGEHPDIADKIKSVIIEPEWIISKDYISFEINFEDENTLGMYRGGIIRNEN